MVRQNINIGDFEFICDMYIADKDYLPAVYKEYVILRNLDFINNIACDKDIYFLEKSVFEQIKDLKSESTRLVAFPSGQSSFSSNYTDFINMLNFKLETDGGDVFSLYKCVDGEYTNKNIGIKCNKIRIYHPHNKTDLNYIIHLDNIINGIHFHYFCNYNNNFESSSENEFKIHNNIYSEFIEIYIPNLDYIFRQHDIISDNNGKTIDNNIYFNDFYNITKYIDEDIDNTIKHSESSWVSVKNSTKTLFDNIEMLSFVPFYLLLNPYMINTNSDGVDEKVYFRMTHQESNNYNAFPLNITLYPYEFSEINNQLLMKTGYDANTDTYVTDHFFNLVSNIGFYKGQLCVINRFEFNNKYDEKTNPNGLTTQEAYANYNGLIIEKRKDTSEIYCPVYEKWKDWTKYSYNELKNKLNDNNISVEERENIKHLIELQEESFDTDKFDPDECFIKCCGYQIEISTDYSFKNIIASDYQEMNFIDDFQFSLFNLFDSWYNIPGTLIIRIKFIDKYLGIVMNTGNIILSKELLKYCINASDTPRLYNDFVTKQNDLSDNMSWTKINAKESTFNFIDKINCVVSKSENINDKKYNTRPQGVRVIYKPIFYKTQELQSISLSDGFKQKIGINLSQYMTKVDLFKLVIEGKQISEYGRNDIYVIFEVNAGELENTSGIYNIIDSDNNYISSGTYSKL